MGRSVGMHWGEFQVWLGYRGGPAPQVCPCFGVSVAGDFTGQRHKSISRTVHSSPFPGKSLILGKQVVTWGFVRAAQEKLGPGMGR